jgi:hypothetical protein
VNDEIHLFLMIKNHLLKSNRMHNPFNKQFVHLYAYLITIPLLSLLQSCNQEKKTERSENKDFAAVQLAWNESGEWVQKLSVSPEKIIRNLTWGQDFQTITDSLELSETQPEKGKSYTIYFDETDLNFSDITYIPNKENKLAEINFDIFVESGKDVDPLIEQWTNYLEVKFGASRVQGKTRSWTKNKNTRIILENVSTPKDPGIKISFSAVP